MKIENQVCNESQARVLQNLGIKYKNYQFAFVDFGTPSGQETVLCRPATETEEFNKEWAWFLIGRHSKEIRSEIDEGTLGADGGVYPAFTVAELGVMLPVWIGHYKDEEGGFVSYDKKHKEYVGGNFVTYSYKSFHANTEVEARAAMLIYLLENKLITSEEVNKRLSEN